MSLSDFLKDVAKDAAKEVITETAYKGLKKFDETVTFPAIKVGKKVIKKVSNAASYVGQIQQEASQKRFEKKAIAKHTEDEHLFIRHNTEYLDQYEIYSPDGSLKYSAAGNLYSGKKQVVIFDEDDEQIAIVRNKKFAIRSPLTADFYTKPQDFLLIIGDEEVGQIKSRFSMSKILYTTNLSDWRIEGSLTGLSFSVYSGEDVIMSLEKKFYTKWGETYVLSYPDPDYELYYLMLSTVIALGGDLLTKIRKKLKEDW